MPDSFASDGEDMEALRTGEREALDRLMNRWQSSLRGFLYRYTQNESDAMDLAQETFLRVFQHRDRFRSGARFSTWLFSIGLNLARDRARRKDHLLNDTLSAHPEPADHRNARFDTETGERARAVRAAIAELPEDLRAAVILFEYDERSHSEIADIVGATPKAVETRLYRARLLLRKSLRKYLDGGS